MLIRFEIDIENADDGCIVYEKMEEILRTWVDKCVYGSLKVDNK